jgi:membrane-bound lytic murein transglycosylase A
MSYRRILTLFIIVFLVLSGLGLWYWYVLESDDLPDLAELIPGPPAEDRLVLEPARFADLRGWGEDAVAEALPALLRSCGRIANLPDGAEMGGAGFAGKAGDWKPACAAAARVPPGDSQAARAFFEAHFEPVAVTNNGRSLGLFTGYYEPLLHGSRRQGGRYTVPLYLRPPELVMVELGDFREELKGQRIAGRVVDGSLEPFPDRREIDQGALAGRRLELVWVDDPVDAFFLHIQGSGRIRLAEGGEMRVGYAAQNGHPYFAIGRELIERGALRREEVSMQSIRKWLEEHPEEAEEVMRRNASYVFFQEIEGEGPLGAEGVPLTPGRSLAVDRKFLPLGVPVWLAASLPPAAEGQPGRKLRRLMVAQDTGGAIRGPVRGDVFWGHGEEAADLAGRMRHRGRLWALLPKSLTPASSPTAPSARSAPSRPGSP